MRSEDAQVVGEDLDESLALAAGMGASAQAAAEPAFDARMDTFALPTLPVFAPMEAALHLPAVTRLGPFAPWRRGLSAMTVLRHPCRRLPPLLRQTPATPKDLAHWESELVISPFVSPKTVFDGLLDHTLVLKFIAQKSGGGNPYSDL